ncbi:MAG: HEAT repeat domain-containing protein, partial [Deltaproteobacteria bacterium]|nr:HEAT repeat domain-containing protein [Deltaproteobacteria bacterium]
TAAVPALFAALADGNLRVAHAAIGAIQSLGVADTGARTLEALRTGAPAVRRHALRIIAYLGFVDAFDAVLDAVADPDPRIVQLAVAALGPSSDPRVDATLTKLARDPREAVRSAAMRVTPHRSMEFALQLLESGLADEAAWVRYYACQALGRLGAPAATHLVVGRLSDATPHVRIAAIEALGHLDTAAAWQALSSAIRSEDPDERRAALGSMALRTHDHALPYLLDGSVSEDVATRLIALSGLVRRPERAALDALAVAAQAEDREVSAAALSLLTDRTDSEAAGVLVTIALASDLEHPVHQALARPGASRIEAIASRLTSADDREAGLLAAALSRMHHEDATAALFDVLADNNAAARRAIAGVLVGLGAHGARAAVARLALQDPDPEVRRICAAASAG